MKNEVSIPPSQLYVIFHTVLKMYRSKLHTIWFKIFLFLFLPLFFIGGYFILTYTLFFIKRRTGLFLYFIGVKNEEKIKDTLALMKEKGLTPNLITYSLLSMFFFFSLFFYDSNWILDRYFARLYSFCFFSLRIYTYNI